MDPSEKSQEASTQIDRPDLELSTSIDMEKSTVGEATNRILRIFRDSAGLPQRSLRSASLFAGEFVRESAHWLIPSAFRNSKSYSIFVQQMLDFVVHDIGGVKRALAGVKAEWRSEQVDLARKTVGNLLDMTAFATFHFAPVTVLATFSDIAYGSKSYLNQLAERLKQQGIVQREAELAGASDLIGALEQASAQRKESANQHPFSIEGLRKTIRQTQEVVQACDAAEILSSNEISQLWLQMLAAADEQHASLWDVSATMSIVALNQIQAVESDSVSGLQLSGDMFREHHIVQHYWESLREIERNGLLPMLSKSSQPYLEAVWTNFGVDQRSWTELVLSGDLLRWRWSQLSWPKLARDKQPT